MSDWLVCGQSSVPGGSSTKAAAVSSKKKSAVGVQRKLSHITDELASVRAPTSQPPAETKGSVFTPSHTLFLCQHCSLLQQRSGLAVGHLMMMPCWLQPLTVLCGMRLADCLTFLVGKWIKECRKVYLLIGWWLVGASCRWYWLQVRVTLVLVCESCEDELAYENCYSFNDGVSSHINVLYVRWVSHFWSEH